jgi:hypothetical protein
MNEEKEKNRKQNGRSTTVIQHFASGKCQDSRPTNFYVDLKFYYFDFQFNHQWLKISV